MRFLNPVEHLHQIVLQTALFGPQLFELLLRAKRLNGWLISAHGLQNVQNLFYCDGDVLNLRLFLQFRVDSKIFQLKVGLVEVLEVELLFKLQVLTDETRPLLKPSRGLLQH